MSDTYKDFNDAVPTTDDPNTPEHFTGISSGSISTGGSAGRAQPQGGRFPTSPYCPHPSPCNINGCNGTCMPASAAPTKVTQTTQPLSKRFEQLKDDYQNQRRSANAANEWFKFVRDNAFDIWSALKEHEQNKTTSPAIPPLVFIDPAFAPAPRPFPETIHIFDNGRAICGAHATLRLREWPAGHTWVGKQDADQANCPECCKAAAII